MLDSHSLAEYSSEILNAPDSAELDQRLGLYRVFLKLYEHHRGLLDEILELENTSGRSRARFTLQYVQGTVQGKQAHLITNLLKGNTQMLLQPQGVWVIGRDRKVALPIQDRRLSRRHAAIQYLENQGFYLVDLNSTNGSFVNGEPIRHSVCLKDGDQVRLGSLSFTFFVCQSAQVMETIPLNQLDEINQIRKTTLSSPPPSNAPNTHGMSAAELDGYSGISTDETSMFLHPPITGNEIGSELLSPQLSTSEQDEILDRFLKRPFPETHH